MPNLRLNATPADARADLWIVGLLTALAFALRFACFRQSLFGDELFLYLGVNDRSLGQALATVHDTEKTPPLGFLLGWLFTRGNAAPELVRLPSLLASVAGVPLIYMLGVRTLGRGAALVAAAWLAISPFEIFYGTESRSYTQVATLLVASTVALLLALEEDRKRWWAMYALTAIAAVYTHYIAALTLIPQAVWALWTHRGSGRRQLLANGLVLVAFLPWLPTFLVQLDHSSSEAKLLSRLAPLTLSRVGDISVRSLAGRPFEPLGELPGRLPLAILAVAVVVAAVLGARELRGGGPRWRPKVRSPGGLLLVVALAPLAGLVLYSLRPDTSFMLVRNLAGAVPYALILLGALLTRPGRPLGTALAGVALAAVAVGTIEMVGSGQQRPDARAAAHYVDANAGPAVPVVDVQTVSPYDRAPAYALRSYLERPHRVYPLSGFGTAWRVAAGRRSPILVSTPRERGLLRLLAPPRRYADGYRLAGEQRSPGTPYGLVVRRYEPR